MRKEVLKNRDIYYAGRWMSDEVSEIRFGSTIEEKDSPNFATGAKNIDFGLEVVEITMAGMLPVGSATDDPEGHLFGAAGASDVVHWGREEGHAIGSVGMGTRVNQRNRPELGAQVGDLHGFTIQFGGRGTPLLRGLVAENGGNRAATGVGNGVEFAAGVPTGKSLWALLQIHYFDGVSLDIDVETDADNAWASPVVRASHAQFAGTGAELLQIAGPITDTWVRWNFTFVGTLFRAAGIFAVQ